MNIILENISKRYLQNWILKDISVHFESNQVLGITGANGSGKSTLLQIISGYLSPSRGKISWILYDQKIDREDIYRYISYAGPYVESIDDYTLMELIDFYKKVKPIKDQLSTKQIIQLLDLGEHRNKFVKYFSSGMRQRLHLGLAILSKTNCLLLDEPSSFLDESSKAWLQNMLINYSKDRTVIIASNDTEDFDLCKQVYKMSEW